MSLRSLFLSLPAKLFIFFTLAVFCYIVLTLILVCLTPVLKKMVCCDWKRSFFSRKQFIWSRNILQNFWHRCCEECQCIERSKALFIGTTTGNFIFETQSQELPPKMREFSLLWAETARRGLRRLMHNNKYYVEKASTRSTDSFVEFISPITLQRWHVKDCLRPEGCWWARIRSQLFFLQKSSYPFIRIETTPNIAPAH